MRLQCFSAGHSGKRRQSTPSRSLHLPHPPNSLPSTRKRSLATKRAVSSSPNQESLDIYFDDSKRKQYLHSVIDHYFTPGALPTRSGESTGTPYFRRKPMTSQHKRRHEMIGRHRGGQRIIQMAQTIDPDEMNSPLPVISEGQPQRPASQHFSRKRQARPLLNLNNEDIQFESNRDSLASKKTSQVGDVESQAFSSLEGKRKSRVKVFGTRDDAGLVREKLVQTAGMKVLWQFGLNDTTIQFRPYTSLKRLCYSSVQHNSGFEPLLIIYPKPYYHRLFLNNCEQLTDIVVQLCRGVVRGRGNIASNQISIDRVARMDEKQFYVTDWSKAGYYEETVIQGRVFPTVHDPLLKEAGNWAVSPEYLAPEMLRAVKSLDYGSLWTQPQGIGACQVWSIGLLLAQLVTLVPLGWPHYCKIKNREETRKGLMGCRVKTVEALEARQRNLRRQLLRWVNDEVTSGRVPLNQKLLDLLPRMLEDSPQQRISAEQVITLLK